MEEKGSHKESYLIELIRGHLKRIEKLKEETRNCKSIEDERSKKQEIVKAYHEYATEVRSQLIENGEMPVNYKKYDNQIENIFRSV